MKRKTSVGHDEAMTRRLRKDPEFAAEYLKAALEDEDKPRVLLVALRHVAQARGIAKVARAAGDYIFSMTDDKRQPVESRDAVQVGKSVRMDSSRTGGQYATARLGRCRILHLRLFLGVSSTAQ
jgi:hypothetical protein